MRKVLLVVNPIAGKGRGARMAPLLADKLAAAGVETEVFLTTAAGQAGARTSEADNQVDLITAMGGDGTLNEILNGNQGQIPLALFPMGTANVLALELGLPRSADGFVDLVKSGQTRGIDVMRANGRLGFFALGVGFDGMVIQALARRRSGSISKWSYLPALWEVLRRYRTPRLRVTVDGKEYPDISFALVANTRLYGGSFFSLSRERQLDDGLFECYLFRGKGRLALLKYLFRGLARRLLRGDDPLVVPGKQIRIESDVPVPYEIDGEFGGETPVEIEILPRKMEFLCQEKQ